MEGKRIIQPHRDAAAAIDATAAAWVARVDRGPLSADEQRDLEAWVGGDSRRAGAYARARAVSAHFDMSQALGPGFAPERRPEARAQTRRWMMLGGAAIAASAVVGVATLALNDLKGRLSTRKGDIRRVTMSDGSAVTLNTDSAVRTAYSHQQRSVALLRGEALFDVAKDSARPFVVAAGEVAVRAVGTSFTVRRRPDGAVTVLVREGVVEVRRGSEPLLTLTADHMTNVEAARPLQPVALPVGQADRRSLWIDGLLDLNGLTLAEAAAEYERYSDRRIEIDDPAIGGLKVTGVFSVSDPDSFARAAALSLNLEATSTPDGIRLSAGT